MTAEQFSWRRARADGTVCRADTSRRTSRVRSALLHVCQKPSGHGDLHECYCGQLFDHLGEQFQWETYSMPTVWTAKDTDGT
jgi:hypothetical protein